MFRKQKIDLVATLERELETVKARREKLQTQLVRAERAIDAAVEERRTLLLEAENDEGPNVSGKAVVAGLRDEKDALLDAIEVAEARIAHAQSRLVQECERQRRAAASKELRERVDLLNSAAIEFERSAGVMVAALGPTIAQTAHGNPAYTGVVESLLRDVVGGVKQCAAAAAAHASAILENGADIIVLSPPVAAPPSAPEVERRFLFAISNVQWREPDGTIMRARQYSQIHVPLDVAERALARNLACEIDSERANQLRACFGSNNFGPPPGARAVCIDLDAPPPQPAEKAAEQPTEAPPTQEAAA